MRAATALVLAAALPAYAQMYKCVDERGVTHYSDKPRPGCRGREVDIRPQQPLSGKVDTRKDDLPAQEQEFRRRRIETQRAEERDKAALWRRCAQARSEVQRLSGSWRIVTRVDEKGERVYMEDAERERRLAKAREQLRGCP